jgi:thiol-disulfide isomerase/thioredoxin
MHARAAAATPARALLRACCAAPLLAALACGSAQAMHLTDIDGKTHSFDHHHGKWVVLNIWATWCAPCIHEMPELEALARARPDIVVLGLAADGEDALRLRQFAQALKVNYPIIAGDSDMLARFKVKAYPTTLLYNPSGELVMTKLGQVTRRELEARLPASQSADP